MKENKIFRYLFEFLKDRFSGLIDNIKDWD
jgi:hypothetical protein